jgi:mono/diheme cytochrome c family protein
MTARNVLLILLSGAAARAQAPDFSKQLYPVFEQAQCRNCHTHDGVASGTRLQFPDPDVSAARIQAFGISLAPLE